MQLRLFRVLRTAPVWRFPAVVVPRVPPIAADIVIVGLGASGARQEYKRSLWVNPPEGRDIPGSCRCRRVRREYLAPGRFRSRAPLGPSEM
jgi:hypothetical protein